MTLNSVPLARGLLAAYGSLAFPLAAAFIALQVIVPTHYAEATGLSLSLVGVILLVARLADTVTDPLIGYLSDRFDPGLGHRKSYVVLAAPFLALATWYLFNPAPTAGGGYLLIWTVAIYIAGTIVIVPMTAWGAELSADYHQRSRVTGTRVALGLLGTLAALSLPVLISGEDSAELGNTLFGITLLVVFALLITVVWAVIRVPDRARNRLPPNTLEAAFEMLRVANPFRQLLLSFLLNAVGNAIPATLFLLFVTYVLEVPEQAGVFLFLYFVSAAMSVPLWVALARRIGKHQSWSIAIVVACCFFLWAPLLDAGDVAWFYLIVVATGFATGADLALPAAINGDVIEWDAVETGYRRPGLFFALWGTATKLSYALAIGIAFPLLEAGGFSTESANTNGAIAWLAFLYGGPCIVFKLLALWFMRGYPITESRHAELRQQLASE